MKLYRRFFSSVLLLATTIGVQAQTYYCCTPCCAPPPPPCCYEVRQDAEPKQRAPGVVFEATVLFDTGSYSLNEAAKERLFVAARELRMQLADELVIVSGHTDSRGSAESNEVLSLRRAIAVKNYLAGAGVGVSRMLAFGFGERQPVATNGTAEGRKQNRRVVVNIKQQ